MYVRSSHRARNRADVVEGIERNMFATLVTGTGGAMIASHLPFLFEPDRGEHGTLFAHMARANPQAAVIGDGAEALVLFVGPHGYISPSWYEDRATAPTWDYVAVHCYGTPRVHTPDETRANIERLVSVMERNSSKPWSISELSDAAIAALLGNVVSFEIPLTRIDAKFKLNQGEKPERTHAAIAELERRGENALAEYMRRYNG